MSKVFHLGEMINIKGNVSITGLALHFNLLLTEKLHKLRKKQETFIPLDMRILNKIVYLYEEALHNRQTLNHYT